MHVEHLTDWCPEALPSLVAAVARRFERAVEHYESRVDQTSTHRAMLDELARLAAGDPGDRE